MKRYLLYFLLLSIAYIITGFILKTQELVKFKKSNIVLNISAKNIVKTETAFNIALGFYPNLKNEFIILKELESDLPYFSRPTLLSIIFPFCKRVYLIGISSESSAIREPTLLHNLSIKAKIGALGHELAHIFDYKEKNMLSIIVFGINYLNDDYKEKVEKHTDRIAISHNLYDYIYHWVKEVYPIKIQDGNRGTIYYSPAEIELIKPNN